MRITIKWKIKRLKFSLMIGLATKVQGINSNLKNGWHMLMWEFDHPDPNHVYGALRLVQDKYNLPNIYIARSHTGGGFHAYCFRQVSWMQSIHIVSDTTLIDPGYVNMCAMRGHWTLRLTDKGQGAPEYVGTLPSDVPEDCSIANLESYVEYEAWSRRHNWTWGAQ